MTHDKRIGALEQALARATKASPVPRAAASDDEIRALIEAAVADTAAGHGYPPDLDRVREAFDRDITEEGRR